MSPAETAAPPDYADVRWQTAWRELGCRLPGVQSVFEASVAQSLERLTEPQLHGLWGVGRRLGQLGRGAEPVIAWLTHWPAVLDLIGDEVLDDVLVLVQFLHKSPNSAAIAPLIGSLVTAARRLASADGVRQYLSLLQAFTQQTTGSIHGRQQTQPSPGLLPLLAQAPRLLQQLSMAGLRRWVLHGARVHAHHPPQQVAYFSLQSPDSLAIFQRERHGTLLVDVQRQLGMTQQALWQSDLPLAPLTGDDAAVARMTPALQADVLGLPDVLEDLNGVTGLGRYRLMLLHAMAHRHLSGTCIADNWSPAQRLAVEWFEDARIDRWLLARWPGLRPDLLALLPPVQEGECDDRTHACLRHRLALWNRAVLDPAFTVKQPALHDFVQRFEHALAESGGGARDMATLALSFVGRTRCGGDALPNVFFAGSLIDWRDDNRHLWQYIEDGDEEDTHSPSRRDAEPELHSLPPRLYPEWDHISQSERPDWVKVYEYLHPSGQASDIDRLTAQHSGLTRRLARVLDQLKPQGRQRLRRLEQGSELDLDLAQQAWIDWRSGHTPDERVQQHWLPHERDVSVQLVLDLSASLAERIPGTDQTVLQVSQAAVALLAWALDRLGDPLAIGGFHSNTRQEVRYMHLKGFEEAWGAEAKARLAAVSPAYSTRTGTALRHASHTLLQRRSPRKLLLLLTDGEPSDVDVSDPDYLRQDARQVVRQLQAQGVFVWCIQLHPAHEANVRSVFGEHYTLVKDLQQLPQTLAGLFLRLTR